MLTKLYVAAQTAITADVDPVAADNPLNPKPSPPPGIDEVATMLFGWGKWILLAAGVLGLFICAGMMIIGRRNRSATAVDGASGIPWVFAGLTVAMLAAGVVPLLLK